MFFKLFDKESISNPDTASGKVIKKRKLNGNSNQLMNYTNQSLKTLKDVNHIHALWITYQDVNLQICHRRADITNDYVFIKSY